MEIFEYSLVTVAVIGGGILAAVVIWDIICEVIG